MTFRESVPPDITEALPFPFTSGGSRASTAFPADGRFDVAIGELGFLLRATREHPYMRAGEQVSKQRIDTSAEAGEQSLSSWWIRSQASWHLGAGAKWYEPRSDQSSQYRFHRSHNVDVWEPGKLMLLPSMSEVATGLLGAVHLSTASRGGADGFVVAAGTELEFHDGAGAVFSAATVAAGGLTQPAVIGQKAYVGGADAVTLYDFAGSGAVSTLRTCTGVARAWWVKSRLFVALGAKVFWVDATTSGTALGASPDLLVFEHPDPEWVWTDIAESPDAILLAGYSASTSGLYSVTVTEDAGVPTFTGARQVAALPPGETVRCMGSYLGSFVVLGTNKGVRVGAVGDGGLVRYGPLTVETDEPVTDVSFSDRWAYLPVSGGLADGSSGVVRVDLSAPVGDTEFYAWACDVSTGTTDVASSVCFIGGLGDRPVVAAGSQVFMAGTEPAEFGWLESGRIRYGTTERKNFRLAQTNGVLNDGGVEVSALTESGVESRVVAYGPTTGLEGEAAINLPRQAPASWMAFRLYLTPSSGGVSPEVSGFAVKALPSVRKPRLFQFPLSCFDFESDRFGNMLGGFQGSALVRVQELEAAEDEARPIRVEDRRVGESFVGVVDSVEFSGRSSPDRTDSNFGGTVVVTLRRL